MKKNAAKKKEEPTRESNGKLGDRPLSEQIAERAYDLYQKRGEQHGNDLHDWLEAERIILSERPGPVESERTGPVEPATPLKSKPASGAKTTRKRGG